MASDEQTRILNMVAEGTISPVEAGDLLAALDRPMPPPPVMPTMPTQILPPARPRSNSSLVIQIVDGDDTKVNIRIPLALARAAGKFIPRQAHAYLNEHEINIEGMLESLQGSEGENTLLEVHDGDSHVLIKVE